MSKCKNCEREIRTQRVLCCCCGSFCDMECMREFHEQHVRDAGEKKNAK